MTAFTRSNKKFERLTISFHSRALAALTSDKPRIQLGDTVFQEFLERRKARGTEVEVVTIEDLPGSRFDATSYGTLYLFQLTQVEGGVTKISTFAIR